MFNIFLTLYIFYYGDDIWITHTNPRNLDMRNHRSDYLDFAQIREVHDLLNDGEYIPTYPKSLQMKCRMSITSKEDPAF